MLDLSTTGEFWQQEWVEFYNNSGEEIPPFACIRVSATITRNNRNGFYASKPNTYGAQFSHRFNGPTKVAAGNWGVCTIGPQSFALYDSADGSPGFGESWGPRSGTWKLKKNTGGFRILGNADTSNTVVWVQPFPMLRVHGQTDAAHAKDATGVVSIFYRSASGTYTDSGENFTNVLNSFCSITAANKDVEMVWDGGNGSDYWSIVAGEI